MSRLTWNIAGMAIACLFVWLGHEHDKKQETELAQAAYDYGKQVGHVLGSCELAQGVARENPEAEWTVSSPVQQFLTTCGPLLKKHGPGTTALIKVPK